MAYVDGIVLAVPRENRQAYQAFSEQYIDLFKSHGAEQIVECWGHDVPDGVLTSFLKAVRCKADETVVFSWIRWPSKAVRDAAMEQIENAPSAPGFDQLPFDGKRMIMGGFDVIVDA
jgi:uncharacterized protein YbaA (DUF1428 family)